MDELEKDKIIEKFIEDQRLLMDLPAITQMARYYQLMSDIINNIWNKAREEGFKQGLKQARIEYERKSAKLN